MKLSAHFSLAELTVSERAARLGIKEQFEPPADILENLQRLANQLEVVRILLGSTPIIVSSAYRCKALNDQVPGSSNTSAHILGLAADFTAPGFGKPITICRRLAETTRLEFDQVINEYNQWCHFSVDPRNRRQALTKFAGDSTYHVGIIEKQEATIS